MNKHVTDEQEITQKLADELEGKNFQFVANSLGVVGRFTKCGNHFNITDDDFPHHFITLYPIPLSHAVYSLQYGIIFID